MWTSDFTNAPTDGTQILVRHPDWQCPAVAYWDTDVGEWLFAEEVIAGIDGGIILDDADGGSLEWVAIPE